MTVHIDFKSPAFDPAQIVQTLDDQIADLIVSADDAIAKAERALADNRYSPEHQQEQAEQLLSAARTAISDEADKLTESINLALTSARAEQMRVTELSPDALAQLRYARDTLRAVSYHVSPEQFLNEFEAVINADDDSAVMLLKAYTLDAHHKIASLKDKSRRDTLNMRLKHLHEQATAKLADKPQRRAQALLDALEPQSGNFLAYIHSARYQLDNAAVKGGNLATAGVAPKVAV